MRRDEDTHSVGVDCVSLVLGMGCFEGEILGGGRKFDNISGSCLSPTTLI